ncbi:MAG: hypothetical protein JSU86_14400 [Phycisphaerales bacterium]|nr:MAG: hypothetical protein JSU86_14400 [Phycisphaerales bacterium]
MPPNKCAAGFINNDRTDYLFFGDAELPAVDLSTINYRYGSWLLGAPFPAPDYETYLGSLILDVSADAKGTFYVGFNPLPSQVVDEFSIPVPMMGFVPGLINIETGKCCYDIGGPGAGCIGGDKPKGTPITKYDCYAMPGKTVFYPSEYCTGILQYDCPECLSDYQCADGDACSADTCDVPTGVCYHTPVAVGANECCYWVPANLAADVGGLGAIVSNVDGNPCTEDLCSKPGGCAVAPQCGVPYNPPIPPGDNPECLLEPPCRGCKDQAAASPCDCGARDCGGPVSSSDPVYLFSGEFHESAVDLRIPGRGTDFVWARKYRSRIGPDRPQGNCWDGSYDVRIEQAGPDLALFDGNTRQDTYSLQPDGTWAKPGFFRVINQNPDESYTLTFEDTSTWDFSAFDGSPAEGKLTGSTDRNGNTMGFDYDGLGRLVRIHDTLDTPAHDRDITIAYNADGFVESVTDWTGRSVTYEYYDGVEPGGSFGDLKSVTTPAVVGTPNGNDFPEGKTTVYTYSTGFADDRLNHNLLTITDPKGQTYLTNEYADTQNPGDINFDHVVRQIWGASGDVIDFVYVPQTPTSENGFAITKTIVNDRNGNVREYFYNASNQAVIQREYTGQADPDLPTTETQNRPTGQLRPGDPPYFESRWLYNAHSLPTLVIHPNLNGELFVYDESNPNPRSRGNLLEHCWLPGPLGGDQVQICEYFEYDDGFGGCCGTNFVIRHVDGRGNETLHDYDEHGNRIHTTHRIPSIVEDWEYNPCGQMCAHILPDNGSGHRRRDEYAYHPQPLPDCEQCGGYLKDEIVDATGFALTTTYEYDDVGNITRVTDPRGHDTQYVYNQLNQVVREISREVTDGSGVRYERDTFYDANDNVVRVDIQNIDDQGNVVSENIHFTTIYEYEILNYRIRSCEEAGSHDVPRDPPKLDCSELPEGEFITTEYEYDENRNRTLVRYGEAVEGRQPYNMVRTLYDERDLVFREIRAEGDPDQSTTQYDYDGNRNRTRVSRGLEDILRVTDYTYDGYDRLVSSLDPMGNVTTYHYDANHNRVSTRTDGELVDIPGGAGNVRLHEAAYAYDPMDRLTRTEIEFFDTDTQIPIDDGKSITQTFYSDSSQVIRGVDDNGHETLTTYDTANRRSLVTDQKGNTVAYTYDENSNVTAITEVEKSDLGNPDRTFVTTYAYDNLDRLTRTTDNVGNTNTYGYDARDNRTVTVDALDHETRYVYDGINRLIATIRDMDGDGADADAVPGDDDPDIVTTQAWDDTSRLVGQTDDNGNTTAYIYDALNRMTTQDYADFTQHSYTYDVHDNRITATDANGSVATNTYDLLDRLTNRTIVPGAGVSSDTTFEIYRYDGLSRIVHAEDDDSLVTRSYDSLSRVTRETLNGQTTTSTYDGVGNQLTCTYPGGRIITTTYDDLDRKKTISDGGGTIATYEYVGPGRVERREYGNGTRTDYSYDGITGIPNPPNDFGVKRIIGTTHTRIADATVIDQRTYTWDRMYNKTQRKDVRTGGPLLTHNYSYDDIYRLVHTTVTEGLPPLTIRETDYTLDGVGNREEVAGMPDSGEYVMCDTLGEPGDFQMNQYTSTPFDSRQYDENGNLIKLDLPPAAPPVEPGGEAGYQKVRYISFVPQNPGRVTALRVTLTSLPAPFDGLNGTKMWVGEPATYCENSGKITPPCPTAHPTIEFVGADLQCTPHCMDWSMVEVVHVSDDEIIPGAVYDVQAIDCDYDFENEAYYSAPLAITTSIWGDLVGTCAVRPCTAPNGVVGIPTDVTACLDKFKNLEGVVMKSRADVDWEVPNRRVDISDVTFVLDAFRGFPYPFPAPEPCPLAATAARTDTPLFGDIRYDYRNQMVEFLDVETGQRHTYAYDALGRRIAKTVNATLVRESLLAPPARISTRRKSAPIETRYFYDGWQVVEERDGLGLTQATYVYGLYIDEVLNMRRPSSPPGSVASSLRRSVASSLDFFYHTDDLYNVMAITDATGSVVERSEYEDYGQPADPVTGEAIRNPYRFTGRRFDPETSLYYYRTRYLDPRAGRFTTRDTIGLWSDPGNLGNPRAFVSSNPVSRLDPFGTQAKCPKCQDEMENLVKNCTFCRDRGIIMNVGGSQCYREMRGAGNRSRHCCYREGQLGGPWADHIDNHNPAKGKKQNGDCKYSGWWTFWHFILDTIPGSLFGDPYEWQKSHRQGAERRLARPEVKPLRPGEIPPPIWVELPESVQPFEHGPKIGIVVFPPPEPYPWERDPGIREYGVGIGIEFGW